MFTLTLLVAAALFAPPQAARPVEQTPAAAPVAVQYLAPFEISDNHERLAGSMISMIGNVDDAFGTRAFTIDDDLPWNHSGDILVIAPEMKKDFGNVAYVRIQGRVVRFSDEDVQKFIAEMPAIAGKVREFKDRAIVVAASVTGPDGEDLTNGKDRRP
jgi:hypothetical protein